MSFVEFAKMEFAAAFRRGVRQYVLIGTQPPLCDALEAGDFRELSRLTVDESPTTAQPATFVPTRFADETLGAALARSPFDNRNASLFIWLGGVGYRTLDNVVASLAFITSLPRGSGVLFNYAGERTCSTGSLEHGALDAMASRIRTADGIKHILDPQAVAAMLRGLGFRQVIDRMLEELGMSQHLVSALV